MQRCLLAVRLAAACIVREAHPTMQWSAPMSVCVCVCVCVFICRHNASTKYAPKHARTQKYSHHTHTHTQIMHTYRQTCTHTHQRQFYTKHTTNRSKPTSLKSSISELSLTSDLPTSVAMGCSKSSAISRYCSRDMRSQRSLRCSRRINNRSGALSKLRTVRTSVFSSSVSKWPYEGCSRMPRAINTKFFS